MGEIQGAISLRPHSKGGGRVMTEATEMAENISLVSILHISVQWAELSVLGGFENDLAWEFSAFG